ncbi:MAG: hypothetical protein ACRD88_08420 [Terriglobia bacterium]
MVRRTQVATLGALSLMLGAAVATPHAEIASMTKGRLPEAEEFGRRAVEDGKIIYRDTCRTKGKRLHAFDVTITTPFASVALAVFEGKKKPMPIALAQWPIEPPENQSVIVSADPAALFPAGLPPVPPANVKKVVLRRGEQLIEARRADTHEVLFPEFDEKHRKYRGGAFYFPLEPFASEMGDLEIVVIPESDEPGVEAVLKLKKSALAKLR